MAVISSLSMLPNETLVDIFVWLLRMKMSTLEEEATRHDFLLTCRHWWEIAINTPSLWSNMILPTQIKEELEREMPSVYHDFPPDTPEVTKAKQITKQRVNLTSKYHKGVKISLSIPDPVTSPMGLEMVLGIAALAFNGQLPFKSINEESRAYPFLRKSIAIGASGKYARTDQDALPNSLNSLIYLSIPYYGLESGRDSFPMHPDRDFVYLPAILPELTHLRIGETHSTDIVTKLQCNKLRVLQIEDLKMEIDEELEKRRYSKTRELLVDLARLQNLETLVLNGDVKIETIIRNYRFPRVQKLVLGYRGDSFNWCAMTLPSFINTFPSLSSFSLISSLFDLYKTYQTHPGKEVGHWIGVKHFMLMYAPDTEEMRNCREPSEISIAEAMSSRLLFLVQSMPNLETLEIGKYKPGVSIQGHWNFDPFRTRMDRGLGCQANLFRYFSRGIRSHSSSVFPSRLKSLRVDRLNIDECSLRVALDTLSEKVSSKNVCQISLSECAWIYQNLRGEEKGSVPFPDVHNARHSDLEKVMQPFVDLPVRL